MKTTCLKVGPLDCNCYLVRDEASGESVVIDPGGDAELIVETCRSEKLAPRFIINTHGHADHIGANAALKRAYPSASLCIGSGDAAMLRQAMGDLFRLLGITADSPEPDLLLHEGEKLEFGSCALTAVETPGHTPGGISLVAEQERPMVVFCGDLVFRGDVGRTDLPGGDSAALWRSIREKIFTLPGDTVLLCGHDEPTTVAAEKQRGIPREF